jgi:hypothetical protein
MYGLLVLLACIVSFEQLARQSLAMLMHVY